MGIAKIPATKEYIHVYHMWKMITDNERTWLPFKEHFQEAYLDSEEL